MKYYIDMASPSPLKRSVYLHCQTLLCHWNGNSNLPIISINWQGHQIVNDARRQIINRPFALKTLKYWLLKKFC